MSFELAWPHRQHRVRFKRAVRVVPLVEGPPRAFRVLSGNLSKQGMFLAMPEPFQEGTRVALSLEAGGRVLPFAQAEVVWRKLTDAKHEPDGPGTSGFGVRFTNFLHPRAHELVQYLVDNLDTGRPLALPRPKRWKRIAMWSAGAMASAMLAAFGVFLAQKLSSGAEDTVVPPPAPAEIAEVAPPVPVAAPATPTAEATDPAAQKAPAHDAIAAPAPAPVAAPVIAEPEPAPRAEEPTPVAAVRQAARPTDDSSATGLLPLPKCGASSLRWSQHGNVLEIEVAAASGAKMLSAFRMKKPERLVIDLNGAAPKKSHSTKAEIPNVSNLRIGKRGGGGTRLVLDLSKPAQLKTDGNKLTLTY
jgi:hypothetical protein